MVSNGEAIVVEHTLGALFIHFLHQGQVLSSARVCELKFHAGLPILDQGEVCWRGVVCELCFELRHSRGIREHGCPCNDEAVCCASAGVDQATTFVNLLEKVGEAVVGTSYCLFSGFITKGALRNLSDCWHFFKFIF